MEILNRVRLFGGWVFPYIGLTYSLHTVGPHFRYLKCLVMRWISAKVPKYNLHHQDSGKDHLKREESFWLQLFLCRQKKGKQNWAYPKNRKKSVCFFKAGGGSISSFGTNWLKLTWTSKSHFVWHGVFTSWFSNQNLWCIYFTVDFCWAQLVPKLLQNQLSRWHVGWQGPLNTFKSLKPARSTLITDLALKTNWFSYIAFKGVTGFWMDIWGVIFFWWPHR